MLAADGTPPSTWPFAGRLIAVAAVALVPSALAAAWLALACCNLAPGETEASLAIAVSPRRIALVVIALPLLGWGAAVVLLWRTLHRDVTRPLAQLRQVVEAANRGDGNFAALAHGRRFNLREMQALADSVVRLADNVALHSLDLGAARVEQHRLARDVHHRVKNSLQIISSLLSLHARGATTADTVDAYAAMQARVNALTIVHRWSLDDDETGGVDLRAMLGDLAGAIATSLASPHRAPAAVSTAAVDAVTIRVNAAIPIAFALTELANIAVNGGTRATDADGALAIAIGARRDGARVTVWLAAPAFADSDALAGRARAPSTRIVHGMVRQVGGTLRHDPAAGAYAIDFADVVR
jgi:two-component sensor histidine kinase